MRSPLSVAASAALATRERHERDGPRVRHVAAFVERAEEAAGHERRERRRPTIAMPEPFAGVKNRTACSRVERRQLGRRAAGAWNASSAVGWMIELEPHDVDRQIEQRDSPASGISAAVTTSGRWIIEQIPEALPQIVEELAALGDGADDGREVVVEQHDRRDLARALRAALAHRDADVGGLQRRHVVDPVAGHGDDLAGPLQRLHERELLRRGRARHDVDARERRRRVRRRSRRDLVARRRPRASSPPSPISRATASAVSGWSPVTMIDADAGGPAVAHRLGDARDARDPRTRADRPSRSRRSARRRPSAASSARHAQAITLCPPRASSAACAVQRARASASSVRHREQRLGRALGHRHERRRRRARTTAVSRLRSSVNGNVATRVAPTRRGAGARARRRVAMATSSGSPLSATRRLARPARARPSSSMPAAGTRWASTRRPSVSVPVLSEQMVVTRPMFSTAAARRTSA